VSRQKVESNNKKEKIEFKEIFDSLYKTTSPFQGTRLVHKEIETKERNFLVAQYDESLPGDSSEKVESTGRYDH
jgi:hypothetical protein